MIISFNITQSDCQQTPSPVRIAATSIQHQLYILNAGLNVYQQQNSDLKTKLEYLERTTDEQKAEIKGLQLKVTGLKEQQQNSANSSLPPSSDSPFQQSQSRRESLSRKQRAQAGRMGVGRQLLTEAEVDRMIELRPEQCAVCGALLLGADSRPARRQIVELVNGRAFVTEHRRHRLQCLACRAVNCALWSLDAGSEVV